MEPLLSEFLHILLPVCSAVNKSSRQIHAKAIYTTLSLLSWLHVGSPSLLARAEHSHEQMWNHTQRRIHLFRALDKVSWRPGSHFQNVLVFTGSFNTDAIKFLMFWKIFMFKSSWNQNLLYLVHVPGLIDCGIPSLKMFIANFYWNVITSIRNLGYTGYRLMLTNNQLAI